MVTEANHDAQTDESKSNDPTTDQDGYTSYDLFRSSGPFVANQHVTRTLNEPLSPANFICKCITNLVFEHVENCASINLLANLKCIWSMDFPEKTNPVRYLSEWQDQNIFFSGSLATFTTFEWELIPRDETKPFSLTVQYDAGFIYPAYSDVFRLPQYTRLVNGKDAICDKEGACIKCPLEVAKSWCTKSKQLEVLIDTQSVVQFPDLNHIGFKFQHTDAPTLMDDPELQSYAINSMFKNHISIYTMPPVVTLIIHVSNQDKVQQILRSKFAHLSGFPFTVYKEDQVKTQEKRLLNTRERQDKYHQVQHFQNQNLVVQLA